MFGKTSTILCRLHSAGVKSLVALLLLTLGVRSAASQAPPQPATQPTPASTPAPKTGEQVPAQQDLTLHTNVDEVSLDMVVHDKGKKLILDLKPEELTVTDNGTPVTLTGLRLVRGDSVRHHLISFVFDPFVGPTAKNARNAAEKILKVLPSKNTSIAVLDVRGRLRAIQPFTENRQAVSEAISLATESNAQHLETTGNHDVNVTIDHAEEARKKHIIDEEKELIAMARNGADSTGKHLSASERLYAHTLFAALQESQKSLQDKTGYLNLDALLALVHAQQKLGERKAIIYFTHNVVMDSAAKQRLKTITADSTRAGVTIYTVDLDALNQAGQYQLANATLNAGPAFNPAPRTVDPHGTQAVPMQQASGFGIQGDPGPNGPVWGPKQDIQMMIDFHRQGPAFSPFGDTRSPMAQLSTETGGIYIDASGNLKKALAQLEEDLSTYYEATYIPPIKEYDGSFRTISVKPLRTGLRVQSKTGYFAVAPGTDEGIRPFEVPLIKSLSEATLPSDVAFHTTVLRFGEMPDGNTSSLVVEVPYSALQVKEDAHTNLFSAQVALFAQIKDEAGTVIDHFGDDITRRGALETLDRNPSSSFSFERHFVAAPGKYTLEVAITDRLSGKTGAKRSTFEIADQSKSLAVSDMVLVRKLNNVPDIEEDAINPLRYEHSIVTPNVTGELPEGAKGISMFFMVHPDPASSESGTLEMQVIHDGRAGRRIPLPLNMNAGQIAVPYLASFGSGAVAPGHYEVRAYFSQSGKTAEQTLAFSVAGTDSPVAAKSSESEVTAIAAPPEVNIPGQLTITATKNPVTPLSPHDSALLIEDARERALSYNESLPNFMCIEVTNRSVDASGVGNWKLKDSIVELLRYRDKQESRTTIEVNGETSNVSHNAMKGSLSSGEFGGVLKSVFAPTSKTRFEWKETDELKGAPVQVFNYTVDRSNSKFGVVGTNGLEVIAGFHGQVFIDSATRSVRRITLIADLPKELPKGFYTSASSLRVDYDYAVINEHDYLLPVTAEMRITKGKHSMALNTIEFRDYKRFGSNMRMVDFKEIEPQKN
ncbi:VWA domain-containing protein [Occallatibacter riparius]|uniref:VWA domain-containing protein n=1 Tax=Occallatibacter riparius TaxID=1002689 RepID=A0A9J7BSN3_9BACT|nr:VWA domain-containing protein [Occallatibacter riparius]UWZ85593.1 VWA domain-containing protein [Occallatibacter riparius]